MPIVPVPSVMPRFTLESAGQPFKLRALGQRTIVELLVLQPYDIRKKYCDTGLYFQCAVSHSN